MTCHRFGRSRPVATNAGKTEKEQGVKPPWDQSGDRSPHSKLKFERIGEHAFQD